MQFFFYILAQFVVFLVELHIIKVFAGKGRFRDIIPAPALDALAHFPTEFACHAHHGSVQILHVERRENHAAGAVTLSSFNFLPQRTPYPRIGHEDDVGQIFHMNGFAVHGL